MVFSFEVMKDDIQALVSASDKINSKAASKLRCLILAILSYYIDGLQYRELKSAFGVSDGKLVSNLNQLETFGYVEKTKIQFDNKKMNIYTLTKEGKNEIKKISEWMELMIKIIHVSDE